MLVFYCSPSSVGIFMQIKRMKNIETDHLLWATINHRYKPVRHLLLLCINRATKMICYQIQDRNSICYIWQCLISCIVSFLYWHYENEERKILRKLKTTPFQLFNNFSIFIIILYSISPISKDHNQIYKLNRLSKFHSPFLRKYFNPPLIQSSKKVSKNHTVSETCYTHYIIPPPPGATSHFHEIWFSMHRELTYIELHSNICSCRR